MLVKIPYPKDFVFSNDEEKPVYIETDNITTITKHSGHNDRSIIGLNGGGFVIIYGLNPEQVVNYINLEKHKLAFNNKIDKIIEDEEETKK